MQNSITKKTYLWPLWPHPHSSVNASPKFISTFCYFVGPLKTEIYSKSDGQNGVSVHMNSHSAISNSAWTKPDFGIGNLKQDQGRKKCRLWNFVHFLFFPFSQYLISYMLHIEDFSSKFTKLSRNLFLNFQNYYKNIFWL